MPDDSLTSAAAPANPANGEAALVARLRTAGCVFAEEEARLLIAAARTPGELGAMVDRRAAGVPLEHVVGWAEFCGLRVIVGPGVFVPRRRSEFLVSQAIAAMRPSGPTGRGGPAGQGAPIVLDLCCGSGAVGLAVATALDLAELHAADVDPGATAYARRNLAAAGGLVYEGDLYAPLPKPACAAGSTSSWSMRPTCPVRRSGSCRPRPGSTNPRSRSTAVLTALASTAALRRGRQGGWRPAAAC